MIITVSMNKIWSVSLTAEVLWSGFLRRLRACSALTAACYHQLWGLWVCDVDSPRNDALSVMGLFERWEVQQQSFALDLQGGAEVSFALWFCDPPLRMVAFKPPSAWDMKHTHVKTHFFLGLISTVFSTGTGSWMIWMKSASLHIYEDHMVTQCALGRASSESTLNHERHNQICLDPIWFRVGLNNMRKTRNLRH